MKRTLTIIGVVLGILLIVATALFLYYFNVTSSVKLDRSKLTPDTASVRLYDKDGAEIAVSARSLIQDIPDPVKKAFVAVEDKRFFEHHGIDTKRMLAALWHNLTTFSFAEGASTITQQLIKNTHLSSEKTIARKLKEIKLAKQLEKAYSKDEILTLYLNSIYFGHCAFGIENAAQFYFGKQPADLTVAEGAMLAAIVKSPNRYSPFHDNQACHERRNLVLKLMNQQGYLDDTEYRTAISDPLPAAPACVQTKNTYTDCVFDELDTIFPDAGTGYWGNLKVYTRFDPVLQETLEQTQAPSDVCLLVRDNHCDAICALHATAGVLTRLPASTIKPLLIYAPALEENLISPATPLLDQKTDFGGYSPDDYGGASNKYMSARDALAHSVNIPAVRILNEMGIENGTKYLDRMQLPVPEEDKSLALALGGMRHGYTLPALADGYATFANGGTFSSAGFISRIEDERGNILYSHSATQRRVFSEDVSYLVNDMLQTAVREGTGKRLRTLSFPVCAKTGTAGTNAGNTDAYCISYTRDHVVAAWMGNADNSPIETTGGGLPANAVLTVMRSLYRDSPPTPFEERDDVVRLSFDQEAYENEHTILLADPAAPPATSLYELFRANAKPSSVSTRFSKPSIRTPSIQLRNGTIQITLTRTQYYDYEIKRENRGKIATIYSGPYRDTICDNSVKAGETYVYTVIPKYKDYTGKPVVLPSVSVPGKITLPEDWWSDQ